MKLKITNNSTDTFCSKIIFKKLPGIFILLDRNNSVLDVNSCAEKLFGFVSSKLYGVKMYSLPIWTTDTKLIIKKKIDSASISYKIIKPFEIEYKNNKGKICTGLIEIKLIPEKKEVKIRKIVLLSDISQKKKIEKEVEKFKLIFHKANYGIAILDINNKFEYINRYFAEIHGYKQGDLIGKNLSILHSKQEIKHLNKNIELLIKKGIFNAKEVWHRHKNGVEFPMIMNGISLKKDGSKNNKSQLIAIMAIDIAECKISKEDSKIKENEKKFRHLFEYSPDAFFIVDMKTRMLIDCNRVAEKLTCYTKKDLLSMKLDQLCFGHKKINIINNFKKDSNSSRQIVKEAEIITKNKEKISVSVTFSLIKIKNKLHILTAFRDISESKKAKEKIGANLIQQKLVAELSVQLSQYARFDILMNKALKKIADHIQASRLYIFKDSIDGKTTSNIFEWCAEGVSPQIDSLQDIPYNKIDSFVRDIDKTGLFISNNVSELPQDIKKVLETQNIKSILILPIKIKRRKIGFIGFDQTNRLRKWGKSDINLLKTIASLISNLYEREANKLEIQEKTNRISKEKNKIEAIIKGMGEGIFVVNKEMEIILFNPKATDISGFSEKEVINQKYNKFLKFIINSDKNNHCDNKFIKNTINTGKKQKIPKEIVLIDKQGNSVPVSSNVTPLKDKKGHIIGCVVVFRDMTEEHKVDKIKTEFVSVASHQLKTPLTSILWLSELLLRDGLSKETLGYATDINSSAKKMNKLVDDLLNVAHIQTKKKFEIKKKKVDIIKIINESIIDNNQLAKNYEVRISKDSGIPQKFLVNIDSEKMKQVFDNLINNSIKYSNPAKNNNNVKIYFKKSKNTITFGVKDNGVGIPKNQQNRVFEKFFRADNAVGTETNGTGLGLYIAKAITEGHGGKIRFKSVENKGTAFYIELPIKTM